MIHTKFNRGGGVSLLFVLAGLLWTTATALGQDSCETAMVYCGEEDGTDRKNWCGQYGNPTCWGWTNLVGTHRTCKIGAAKGGCDITKGFDAGFIDIDAKKKKFTVRLAPGVTMKKYEVSYTTIASPSAIIRHASAIII
jgi:hypothetical protein